jgi:two-component system chemotaxis response regulator CheY
MIPTRLLAVRRLPGLAQRVLMWPVNNGSLMKKRILIVDDEVLITKVVSAILIGTTIYDVDTTNNACEAFEWSFTRGYDLLISDVQMPLLNGDQLHASVRELNEGTSQRSPKLLLMSGAFPEGELARRAGGIFYIQKPFAPEILVAKVASILEDEKEEPAICFGK